MQSIDKRIESWEKKLLDLGKRNRLLNFRETKRSNINILEPSISDLYNVLVNEERELSFSHPVEKGIDIDYNLFDTDNADIDIAVIDGDLITNQTITEQQKTLKSLRNKAKTAIEEQGVNVLYLAFGFLNWKESMGSSQVFRSPIVLVPVTLTIESLTSPYQIAIHDDEIVLNPTLKYKLENDFNIVFPEFDSESDEISTYLDKIKDCLSDYNWVVDEKVSLALFSFLKINMYMDLHKHHETMKNNFAVKALCGDVSEIPEITDELQNYDHDKMDRPIDIFQTVDADSSQQDAIVLSKKGISFVLQGPPGTGKSQTITNIISEALADGKKVLFVSEKMAALDVVYKRLAKVGLSDFCLTLHNHKANKKEILQNLGSTLSVDRIKIKEEAIYELDVLAKERDLLNKYAIELHTSHSPLNKTIYETNGILAKLKNAPNIMFNLENVGEISAQEFRNYEYLLHNFSETLGKLSEDYDTNIWKGSNIDRVSHELRQDIEVKTTSMIGAIKPFLLEINNYFDKLNINQFLSFNNLDHIKALFLICENAHKVPKEWIAREDIKAISETVVQFSNKQNQYNMALNFINENYSEEIFNIDGKAVESSVIQLFDKLSPILNDTLYSSEKQIYDNSEQIKSICKSGQIIIKNVLEKVEFINQQLGLPVCQSLSEVQEYIRFLKELNKPLGATEVWFNSSQMGKVINLCEVLEKAKCQLNIIRNQILSDYDKEILEIDFEGMLRRFKTEYTSVFKIFKSTYKHDINTIKSHKNIPVKKMPDDEILDLLNSIKAFREHEVIFSEHELVAKEYFGTLYQGEQTDFVQIQENINTFSNVLDYLHEEVPSELKELILSGNHTAHYNAVILFLENSIQSTEFINVYNILKTGNLNDSNFKTLCTSISDILDTINDLELDVKPFTSLTKTNLTFEMIQESIRKISLIQQIARELKANEQELKDTFKFLFDGVDTNWEEITSSLEWLGKFIPFVESNNSQDDFIDHVLSLQYKNLFHELFLKIDTLQNTISEDFKWINSLYDVEYQMYENPLSNVLNKLNNCIMNLHGLEEWIDFKNARKECYTSGLNDAVEVVLKEKIAPELIIDSFKKRFYKLWLDAISPNYPAVYGFRRKTHEDMIARFKEFDLKQMKIAELRVKEMLISKLPDTNKVTSAVDEVGILKRELSKQRKIMPIRKLFARIPALLPALKPCLMMSPLSVSLFLESELYNFDLVIFDEASQVCTENAVGAIMRSKQIIVAGDNKQLPPTNFFSTTTLDGDYDVDSDDEIDDGSFESILDEMVTVFPERSLKWHYRSKNEQLITFSNVKIYNQSLITFPSSAENIADNGVEYVYVENGVYDRGGKKNNLKEAKEVAKLVFEHFEKSGGRSIGVIAFSEAQQQAIDAEITKLRISNPMYEQYFNEEKDEAFFVKNLENVQGDERDTIIFSIGYAKDLKGVMYMNFGPLSRNGGYRRLNVAITRAKYNVKLVGSVRPTDINLERTNAEGVKMLRSYIEFAINGQSALENELSYNRIVDVDSPFEEAVYDFLVSKGYKVSTQVGCSGYRIDMAVHHPTLDGRFAIGIECDGATYHSSRTARERDRLRQTVLEDMGWKFHRIWSTDWIKDPVAEGDLLIESVDRAIATYEDNFEQATMTHEEVLDENTENYYETEATIIGSSSTSQFKFETYVEANARAARQYDYGIVGLCRAIKHTVEVEYPIHYELLCRRIAPIYGNQKTTVKIRNGVNCGLKKIDNEIIRVGDFFYPKEYDKIIPKAPPMGQPARSITHISDDEIGSAMIMVVADSYGITKNSLFQILAKAFGFNRIGSNITTAFDRVFKGLVKRGELSMLEGKVLCHFKSDVLKWE